MDVGYKYELGLENMRSDFSSERIGHGMNFGGRSSSGTAARVWIVLRHPLLVLLRPHQWIKNLFVAAPLFFTPAVLSLGAVGRVALGFACFSALASAMYVLNDWFDHRHSSANRALNHVAQEDNEGDPGYARQPYKNDVRDR